MMFRNSPLKAQFERWAADSFLFGGRDFEIRSCGECYAEFRMHFAFEAYCAGRKYAVPCDAQTTTSPCGKRITSCGSTQMAGAVAEGHAFKENK